MSATRRLVLTFAAIGVGILLATGVALAANIQGTSGNDTLTGTSSADNIYGYGGDDTMSGLEGGDYLDGDMDKDKLYGGGGADKLNGRSGNDPALDGGNGADTIYGGAGKDKLFQGPNGDNSKDILDGESDEDYISAGNYPTAYADSVECGTGDDEVYADSLDTVASNCETILKLSSYTSSQIKGYVTSNEGLPRVDFNSYLVSGGGSLAGGGRYDKESTSRVKIGDKTLDLTVNPQTGTITQQVSATSGSPGSLSDDQKLALKNAGSVIAHFLGRLETTHQKNQEALASQHLGILAESYGELSNFTITSSGSGSQQASEPTASGTKLSSQGRFSSVGVESCGQDAPGDTATRLSRSNPAVEYRPLQFLGGITPLDCASTTNDATYGGQTYYDLP